MPDAVIYMVHGGSYHDGHGDTATVRCADLDLVYWSGNYGLYKPSECLTLFTSWLGAPLS